LIRLAKPMAICGMGAFTPVGSSAPATCAAMRAGLSAFNETSYLTLHGERVIGATVPNVTASDLGLGYVAALAAPALAECMAALPDDRFLTRVYFGTQPLNAQVSRDDVANNLKTALVDALETTTRPQPNISFDLELVPHGEMSFAHGLIRASECLSRGEADYALVGGAETYLSAARLRKLEQVGRLKTGRNSDGLIPGEGGCFVAIASLGRRPHTGERSSAIVLSLAIDTEQTASGRGPNRGDAWTQVIGGAVADASLRYQEIGFRPTNLSGERLPALEEAIAIMRCFLEPMGLPPGWYISGSVGTIGAAAGALLATWTATAYDRNYAIGDAALCELHSDDGQRAAFVVRPPSRI
jgi:3-oxoacyl-[acyl-carrier-protein] synthase I